MSSNIEISHLGIFEAAFRTAKLGWFKERLITWLAPRYNAVDRDGNTVVLAKWFGLYYFVDYTPSDNEPDGVKEEEEEEENEQM